MKTTQRTHVPSQTTWRQCYRAAVRMMWCAVLLVLGVTRPALPFHIPGASRVLVYSQTGTSHDGYAAFRAAMLRAFAIRHTVVSCDFGLHETLQDSTACPADYVVLITRYDAFRHRGNQSNAWSLPGMDEVTYGDVSRYRRGAAAEVEVYDGATGALLHEDSLGLSRRSVAEPTDAMMARLADELGTALVCRLWRGRLPDIALQAWLGAASPVGSHRDKFDMTDIAGTGLSAGIDACVLLTPVVGIEIGYDYQEFPFDPFPDAEGLSGYYRGNALRLALMVGRKVTTSGMGCLYPHVLLGLNVSSYDEVYVVGTGTGMVELVTAPLLTGGAGLMVRPAWLPACFTLFARVGIGSSAYEPQAWEQIRNSLLDSYADDQIPHDSPDYNVSHVQIGVKAGFCY